MKTLRNCLLIALLLCAPGLARAEIKVGGPTSPDGKVTVAVDLPLSLRTKNVGGTDGAGLCVFTSIGHAARWQGELRLMDFQAKMRQERGGGWPEKVDKMISKYGAGAPYVQYEGNDLAPLKAALDSGLLPAITWNGKGDPHYHSTIAHMVNLVCLSGLTESDWGCILDNNFIGADQLVWCRPSELLRNWKGSGQGWAVFLLEKGPPPPVPVNAAPAAESPGYRAAILEWWYHPGQPGLLHLLVKGGDQVGCWVAATRRFYAKEGAGWRESQPPCPVPHFQEGGPFRLVASYQDFGVEPHGQSKGERWNLSGKASTREECLKLITRHKGKRCLTVVLPRAEREKVLQDLAQAAELAPWRDALVVQGYEPGDVLAGGVGLPNGIVLQAAPDKEGRGKVLHRTNTYTGPKDLATALRKSDPSYDPKKDPDLTRPQPPAPQPQPTLPSLSPASPGAPADPTLPAAAVAIGAVALYVLRKREVI